MRRIGTRTTPQRPGPVSGVIGVPATFLLMTLVMLAFSAGYVAMSRHVKSSQTPCAGSYCR